MAGSHLQAILRESNRKLFNELDPHLSDKESTVLFPGPEKEDFLFIFLQRYSGHKIFHRIEIPEEEKEIRKNTQIQKQLKSDFKFPIVVVNKYFVTLLKPLTPINVNTETETDTDTDTDTESGLNSDSDLKEATEQLNKVTLLTLLSPKNITSETNTDTETESESKSDSYLEKVTEQLNTAEEIVSDIIQNVLRIESKISIEKIILSDSKLSKLSKLSNSQTVKLSTPESKEVLVLPFDSEIIEDFFSNKNGEEEISQRDFEALVATFNILTSTEDEEEEVEDDDQSPYAGINLT